MYIYTHIIYIYASALVLTLGQVEMKFTIYIIHLLRLLPHFGIATKKNDRNSQSPNCNPKKMQTEVLPSCSPDESIGHKWYAMPAVHRREVNLN